MLMSQRFTAAIFLAVALVVLAHVPLAAGEAATECRQTSELEFARTKRLQLGLLYHENLALGTQTNETAPLKSLNSATLLPTMVDGDRCCNAALNSSDCGVNFNITGDGLVQAVIELNRTAFVNEIVTSWYLPCRNEPRPFYTLQFYNQQTSSWQDILIRVLKANVIVKEEPTPCYVIPGDKGDVSLCTDFFDYQPVPATKFRIKFNNSESFTGLPSDFTDGGWLYEMEVHGRYYDDPWELQNDGIAISKFQSQLNVTLGTINVLTANIKQIRLNTLDTKTTTMSANLINKGTGTSAQHLLGGNTTVSASLGYANFTDLVVLSPPAGQYNLTFTSPNLLSTFVLFTIEEGKPYRILVESGSLVSTQSDRPANIPTVTVSVRDPGGNKVANITNYKDLGGGAFDANVYVYLKTNTTATFEGVQVVNMAYQGGTAIFNGMQLRSPPVGDYILEYTTPGVTFNATSTVRILEGPPKALRITQGQANGPTRVDHVVQAETLLPGVSMETLDAGDNKTPSGNGVNIAVSVDKGTLSGTTSYTVDATGAVSLNDMKLVRPTIGLYTLTYTPTGGSGGPIPTVTSTVEIVVGLPTHLRVLPEHTNQRYQSDFVVKFNPIVVQSLDAGFNVVGVNDTVDRNVTVILANATVTLNGTLRELMSSGNATFGQVSLLSPPTATYVLQFSAPDLGFVVLNVNIDIGPGKSLKADPLDRTRASIEVVDFSPIFVSVLDAGGSFVGAEPFARTITAAIDGGGQLNGTQVATTSASGLAKANFTGITVLAPVSKNYTVTFSTPGLISGSMTLVVHPGPARRLRPRVGPTYTYKSQLQTSFDPITIEALDASGTFVSTFQLQESGALNVTTRLVNTSYAGMFSVTNGGSGDLANGQYEYATGSIKFVQPLVGKYLLEFFNPTLGSGFLSVSIITGDAYQLQILEPASLTTSVESAAFSELQGVYLRALDPGTNWANNDQVERTVTVSSNSVTVGGNKQDIMRNGSLTMNGTALLFPTVRSHQVTFSSTGLLPKTITVQVTTGLAYFLRATNETVVTRQSRYTVDLRDYQIRAFDAGNNATVRDENKIVSTRLYDALGRDLTSSLLETKTAQFGGTGVVDFSTGTSNLVRLLSPPQGSYVLSFQAPGLVPANVSVTIVPGPPVRLGSPNTTHVYRSAAQVLISPITLQVSDAGLNPIGGSQAVFDTVSVALVTPNITLTSSPIVTVINGERVFSNLRLAAPAVGTHTLNFSSPILQGLLIDVVINVGDPYRITPLLKNMTIKSNTSAPLPSVPVEIQDVGNNPLRFDDKVVRSANVTVNNGAQFTDASTTVITVTNGVATFNNLALKAPVPQQYTMTVCAGNVTCDTFAVVVTKGDPVALSVQSGVSSTYASSVQLVNAVVRTLDVSGTVTDLPVLASGDVQVASNSTNLRMLSSVATLANGVTTVRLNFTHPLVGVYALTFSSVDSSMAADTVTLTVTPGVPAQLALVGWNANKVYPSDYSVVLDPVTVRVLDEGTNYVNGDVQTRTLTVLETLPFLNKTSMVTQTSSGQGVFAAMELRSPPANASLQLTIQTTGLRSVVQSVHVGIGPARKVKVTPGIVEVATNGSARLPSVTVQLADAGNNLVGATDAPAQRTVTVNAPGNTLAGVTSCITTNGVCTLTGTVMVAPVVTLHTLVFTATNMEPFNVVANVTSGFARALSASISLVLTPSQRNTLLPPVTVSTLDAGGNFTVRSEATVVVQATVLPASGSYKYVPFAADSTLTATVSNGVAVFPNLRLVAPPKGSYRIQFTSGVLTSSAVDAGIRIGPPDSLVVHSYTNGQPLSDYKTLLNPIVVRALDAGGEFVGGADTNLTRTVNVEVLNTTLTTPNGTLAQTLTNGTTSFDNVILQSPVKGELTLRVWSDAIRGGVVVDTILKVEVFVGPVRGIRMRQGGFQSHPCENLIYMNRVQVETVDAGQNFVSTDQGSPIFAALDGFVANTGANNSAATLNGISTFDGLTFSSTLASPVNSGLNTITFSAFIGGTRLETQGRLNVTAGSASRVKVTNVVGRSNLVTDPLGGTYVFDIPYQGAAATPGNVRRVDLPRIEVSAFDNCHSFQPNAAFTVTLNDDSGVLVGGGGIAQPNVEVDAVVDGAAEVAKASVEANTQSPPTTTLSGGVAGFQDVYVTPISGSYTFTVSAPGMASTTLRVNVQPGPAVALEFVGAFADPTTPIVHNNVGRGSGVLSTQPIVRSVDDVRNRVNTTFNARVVFTVDKSLRPASLDAFYAGQDAALEAVQTRPVVENDILNLNGQAQFPELNMRGTHGLRYTVEVEDYLPGARAAYRSAFYYNFTISACTSELEYGANSVPNYGPQFGRSCFCEAGFSLVQPDPNQPTVFRCQACADSTYKDVVGTQNCVNCPENMNTLGVRAATDLAQCVCRTGFYAKPQDPTKCLQCAEGGLCQGGEAIVPKPGFFSFRTGSDKFYACPNPDACINSGNGTCRTGYEGPLCSLCAPGYGRFGVDCTVCGESSLSWFIVVVAVLGICLMLSFLVRTAGVERSKNGTVMKVLLNYLQVIAFVGDLSVQWPPLIVGLFSLMRVSLFSLNLHPVDCSVGPDFYDRYLAYLFFPVVAVFGPLTFYFLYYWGSRALSRVMRVVWLRQNRYSMMADQNPWVKSPEHWQEFKRHCIKQCVLAILISIFLAHPIITKNSFQMFNCVPFYDGQESEAGTSVQWFVAEDLSIDCKTPLHRFWETIALLMVTVYCGGLPLLAVGILYKNRNELHTRKVQDRYRFLYDGYKNHRFYWEAVIMVRKVAIVGVVVLYREKALSQLYASLWVIFASLIAHLFARPYATHLASRLEMFSLIVTLVTLMTGILYYSGEMDKVAEDAMSVMLIGMNAIMGTTFFVVLASGYYKDKKKKAEGATKRLKINELLEQAANQEVEELEKMAEASGIMKAKRRSTVVDNSQLVELKALTRAKTQDSYALRRKMHAGTQAKKHRKNVKRAEEHALWEAAVLRARRMGLPEPEDPEVVRKREAEERKRKEEEAKLAKEQAEKEKKRLDEEDESGSEWETDDESEWETDDESEWETDDESEEEGEGEEEAEGEGEEGKKKE